MGKTKSANNPHDLASFIRALNLSIQSDYDQIRARVSEDPGTAGDQVEETWAQILRNWLPAHYHVVTKGRVIGQNGEVSPQVDVIVLWPSYPPFLLNKKLYLAAGIAAAFECKLTFRKSQLRKLFKNGVRMTEIAKRECDERRNLKRIRGEDYAYEEYHRVFEYGLLAHSYDGMSSDSPHKEISDQLKKLDEELVTHPNKMVDLICIQNMACWASERAPYSVVVSGPSSKPQETQISRLPHPQSGYSCHYPEMWAPGKHRDSFSPLGSLLARLYKKLSYNDQSLIALSRYYSTALATGAGGPLNRVWLNLRTQAIFGTNTNPGAKTLMRFGIRS